MPMTWLRLDSMMLLLVSLLLILVANTSACKANNPSLTTTTKDSKPLLPNLFPFIRSNASQPHKLTQIWDEMLNKTTDYYNEFCNYVEDYKNTYKLLEMKTWRWLGGKRGESFADSLEQSNTNLVMKDLSEARRIATEYLSLSSGSDWDVLGEEDDIMVWKANKLVEGSGSEAKKWPCIKAYTIIEAPADFLCNLLMDSSKVTLFNRYSAGRDDITVIDSRTKVVWNKTRIPYTYKPYDFCTLMHCYKDPSRGVNIIISKAVEHDSVPPHKDYSRSEIYMGINIFMPSKRNPMHTEFTSIAHTRYSGILPYLVSKTSLSASVSYLKNLKAVAVPLSKKESN